MSLVRYDPISAWPAYCITKQQTPKRGQNELIKNFIFSNFTNRAFWLR